ncbi:unnamed protein product [Rotaria sp. Silwood1]|nr:unnamed protein product [Rotaria sp. Silwood1]
MSSTIDDKIDRFCTYILPQKHNCIRKLIVDATYMERILLAGDYPNLTYLELFNFKEEIVCHFTDKSPFQHIFQHQITDLILHNNDQNRVGTSLTIYNRNIYAHIIDLFQNLQHLTIITSSSVDEYPPFFLSWLPSTTYFTSTLTTLCINVFSFNDCVSLLDGRLKQLTTFNVQFYAIFAFMLIPPSIGYMHNLKYFSLTSYNIIWDTNDLIVSLLRRMTHLEKLTLYLRIGKSGQFDPNTSPYIDGTYLQNEILVHMSQLHTFNFYISTETCIDYSRSRISSNDIQQTFKNIKYEQTACIIDYVGAVATICHVYSLPFTFTHLEKITTHFPFILFNSVTHLSVYDFIPFEHEFFMQISQAFPLLKCFSIENWRMQYDNYNDYSSYSVIEFTHLILLDLKRAKYNYIEQFLLETKTYLPHLTHLKVNYYDLKTVTINFTRDTMRRNCSKVNQLIVEEPITFSKDVYQYFPSL